MNRDYLASILLVSFSAACGTEDPAGPMTLTPKAPTILAVEPADNAVGVRADAPIVVTFSEPMDTDSVEAAIDAPTIGSMTYVWDLQQTKVTMIPDQPLAYAEGIGNDPTPVNARLYELALTESAHSVAGVDLEQALAIRFSTLKRMTTTAEIDEALTLHVHSNGQTGLIGSDVRVGDSNLNLGTRGLVTFDLTSITDRAVDVEAAAFNARIMSVVGEPYSISPSMMAYHVMFADLISGYSVAPLDAMGVFSNPGTTSVSQDVTEQVADDLAHRTERLQRSQFRLQFDNTTDGDSGQDYAQFSRATFELGLTYLSE